MNLRKKIFFTLVSLSCIFTISIVSCHKRCRNCTLKPSAVPTVTNASPTGTVSLTTSDIILTFSEAMNPTTISSATVSLVTNTSTTNIIAACTPASGNIVFECSFNTSLISNTAYNLTVSTGATSASGVPLATAYTSNFGTIARFAYVTIVGSNGDSNTVSVCPMNLDGTFGTCITSNPGGFSSPGTIVINPARTLAYISNYGNNEVSVCTIDSTTGALAPCTNYNPGGAFAGPVGLAFNPAGTIIYVTNYSNNKVQICTINPTSGALTSCTPDADPAFYYPDTIVLNANGTIAYITNARPTSSASSTISICPVNPDGSLAPCTQTDPNDTFSGPAGLALNPIGTLVYVVNGADYVGTPQNVSMCVLNLNGSLDTCSVLRSDTFNHVEFGKIVINAGDTFAYIVNQHNSWVALCPINSDGTFGVCSTLTDPTFGTTGGSSSFMPQGIALL